MFWASLMNPKTRHTKLMPDDAAHPPPNGPSPFLEAEKVWETLPLEGIYEGKASAILFDGVLFNR